MAICPECRATYDDEVETCAVDGCALVPDGLVAPAEVVLPAGTMVGEYRIQKKLGAGTFGDVYAGEQPLIGKRVAIKVLNERFASDPIMVSRFVAEARAVNKIRQRNIIDIFSFGVLPGLDRHYFVMELLDGLTLASLIETTGRLPFAVVLSIVRGIADALDAVHEAGITHRDLKPDNVFLATERDGTYFPKLLDFGIAKLAYDDGAHRTGPGMVLGTPRYMSPEQARGKLIDHRTDIYALGVMIHEMLTGAPLFGGDSSVDVLLQHTSEAPPRMSSVCPDLPPELDAPVLAMLAKKPDERPPSAGEAVAALTACAKRLGLDRQTELASRGPDAGIAATRRAPGDGPPYQGTTQAVAPSALAPDPSEASVAKSGAHPQRWKLLAGALAVFAAGIALVSLGRSREPAREQSMTGLELPAAPVSSILAAPQAGALPAPLVQAARDEPLVKPEVVAPEVVEVRLSTRPDDVEVWLGDRRLGSSAAPMLVPRGSESVELRLKKAGFQGETVRLTPDRNRSAEVTLSPLPQRPSLPGRQEPAAAVKPASSASKMDKLLEGRD